MEPLITAYAVAELTLALQIFLSNFLVLWVFLRHRQVRTPTNTYIFSLSLTDFLAGAFGIPATVASVITRAPKSYTACLTVHLVLCVLCTVSTFHLLVIAVDKYITICCRSQLQDHKARHSRARILIVVAWLAGTSIALLPLFDAFGFATSTRPAFDGECHFTLVVDYRYLVYVVFFSTIILPSVIIIACYAAIYRRIGQEEAQVKCLLRASERQRRMHNRRKLLRILLLLVTVYAICWFPLYLINTVDFFFPQYHSTPTITLISVILSHVNCALNPLIYAYGMPGFKQALRRFWTCTRPDLRKLTPNGVDYNGNTHLPHMGAKKSASYMPTHAMPPKKYSTTSAGRDSRHRPYLYLPETFLGKSHPPLNNCRRLYRYSTQEEDPGTENDFPQKHPERDDADLPFSTTWRQVI